MIFGFGGLTNQLDGFLFGITGLILSWVMQMTGLVWELLLTV